MNCFFVSDIHGKPERYVRLFETIEGETPDVVLFGGDLFPHRMRTMEHGGRTYADFLEDFLLARLRALRATLGDRYPAMMVILGNDDGRAAEPRMRDAEDEGLWTYLHDRRIDLGGFAFYGYSFVPPTPFLLKDWERYDVSRSIEPGSIAPEEGRFSIEIDRERLKHETIAADLERLFGGDDLGRAVCMFHAPPYGTGLDRAALDGKSYDHAPLDVHVGSIAIRRMIERRQPLMTLHGHVHESARLTGVWKERIGATVACSAAHDGPELALVSFDPERPWEAQRRLQM